jgi:NAD(P)-dependent dehydrogenase (short-subunit alcohol dehydrogenase family)
MVADINAGAAAEGSPRDLRHCAGGSMSPTAPPSRRWRSAALDAWGRIDILVNNAGITHLPAPMEEVSEEDFDRVLAVNVKSVYLTAREIVPWMKEAGTGAILNIASTAGLSPRPRLNWYNASKGWMITATKTMAVELAPEGIRVNALCPVAGETPLLKSSWARTRRRSGRSSCPPSRSAASPPAGHGRGGGVPVLRRRLDDHRHGARGRWRALHMTGYRPPRPARRYRGLRRGLRQPALGLRPPARRRALTSTSPMWR